MYSGSIPEAHNLLNYFIALGDGKFMTAIDHFEVHMAFEYAFSVLNQLVFDNDSIMFSADDEHFPVLQHLLLLHGTYICRVLNR